jgi:hypothetical protein
VLHLQLVWWVVLPQTLQQVRLLLLPQLPLRLLPLIRLLPLRLLLLIRLLLHRLLPLTQLLPLRLLPLTQLLHQLLLLIRLLSLRLLPLTRLLLQQFRRLNNIGDYAKMKKEASASFFYCLDFGLNANGPSPLAEGRPVKALMLVTAPTRPRHRCGWRDLAAPWRPCLLR